MSRVSALERAIDDAQGAVRVAEAQLVVVSGDRAAVEVAGAALERAQRKLAQADDSDAVEAAEAVVRVAEAKLRELGARQRAAVIKAEEAVARAERKVLAERQKLAAALVELQRDDDDPGVEGNELVFRSLPEFVRELICPTFRREISGRGGSLHWSAEWWRSTEAVVRLEALWRAWESLRRDPATGSSVWLRDHFDPQFRVLTSEAGPFAHSKDSAELEEPLPYKEPPTGMFPVW